ncbi:hypothetical protein HG15A2_31910 [Adhaeretor mobilis]|uniref:Uncharacterized protein n=1 Tax=Adhaeretor mobilis TaxID=1930276 RepID=A0A517MYA0_9BACT|nr:hypothetical protein HG15A2_31910 [Adhaeretor mobilis]
MDHDLRTAAAQTSCYAAGGFSEWPARLLNTYLETTYVDNMPTCRFDVFEREAYDGKSLPSVQRSSNYNHSHRRQQKEHADSKLISSDSLHLCNEAKGRVKSLKR